MIALGPRVSPVLWRVLVAVGYVAFRNKEPRVLVLESTLGTDEERSAANQTWQLKPPKADKESMAI
jgi:hypothetical protein